MLNYSQQLLNQLHGELNLMGTLLDSAAFIHELFPGIYATHAILNEQLLQWNAAFSKFTGLSESAASPLLFSSYIHPDDLPVYREHVSSLAHNEIRTIAVRLQTTTGTSETFKLTLKKHTAQNESVIVVIGDSTVTRIHCDSEVKECTLHRIGTELGQLAIFEYFPQSGRFFRSANHDQLFGMPPNSFESIVQTLECYHPEDQPLIRNEFNILLNNPAGSRLQIEARAIHRDNSIRWLRIAAMAIFSTPSNGQLPQCESVRGCVSDITEQKNGQLLLQEILSLGQLGTWTYDVLTDNLEWSNHVHQIMGTDASTFQPTLASFVDCIHPDEKQLVAEAYQDSVTYHHDSYEIAHRIVRKDTGKIRHLYEKCIHIKDYQGKVISSRGIVQDITRQTRLSDEYFRLFNTMRNGFAVHEIICDVNGTPVDYRFLDISPSFTELTGLTREIIGKTVLEVMPNTEPFWIQTYGKVALTGKPATITEYSKEIQKYFEVTAYCPAPNQFAVIFNDITRRKIAELNLQKSKANLGALLENNPDIIFSIDQKYDFVISNTAANKLFEEAFHSPLRIGAFIEDCLPDSVVQKWNPYFRSALTGERGYTRDMIEQNGRPQHYDIFFHPIYDPPSHHPKFDTGKNVIGVAVFAHNVTAELRKETQFRQAEKMEALGHLAGGIAHDFNNILGAIIGYTELAVDSLGPDAPQTDDLKNVLIASSRAKQLVNQILTFSRQQKHTKTAVELRLIVKEIISLMRAALPSTVTIQQTVFAGDAPVHADPLQMHEVFMNLCTNAVQAMGDTGLLTIDYTTQKCDNGVLGRLGTTPAGTYAVVAVTDTGCGMTPDVIDQMFDPFFTTKDTGKGTGLGLSVVFGIIQEHGGNIVVQSEINRGTRITVYMPTLPNEMTPEASSIHATPVYHTRILLTGQEPAVAALISKMLEENGYSITVVPSMADVAQAIQASPLPFHLVISDYQQDGTASLALHRQLHQTHAALPVAICAGLSTPLTEDSAIELGYCGILRMPFGKKAVIEKISALLSPESLGAKE